MNLSPALPQEPYSDYEYMDDPCMTCQGGISQNCVLPRAVYKIYAEGTWLTVESDWPDHWDESQWDSRLRCLQPMKFPNRDMFGDPYDPTLLDCSDDVMQRPSPPTSVAAGPGVESGEIEVVWTPGAQPAGVEVAGYNVYARVWAGFPNNSHDNSALMPGLPFATAGPDETSLIVKGLATDASILPRKYYFSVAAIANSGRISVATEAAGVNPAIPTSSPRPPRAVKTVLWTVNDGQHPRGRQGVKMAWNAGAPIDPGALLEGFRVYRRDSYSDHYCALLQPGVPPEPVPDLPPDVSVCPDANAVSPSLSAAPTEEFYWDRTAASGQDYVYRVTQVENHSGVLLESPVDDSVGTLGRSFNYAKDRLPPPQGFRAWAPWNDIEKEGIYLRWCPYDFTSEADFDDPDFPQVSHYNIYRAHGNPGGPYRLLATVNATCLNAGQRCSLDFDDPTQPAVVTQSTECDEAAGTCAIVDLTFGKTCSSQDYPSVEASGSNQLSWFTFYYMVTATSDPADPSAESMPSRENAGWLNYLYIDPPTCNETWRFRRDPDGDGEWFVCGDENVLLVDPAEHDTSKESRAALADGPFLTVENGLAPHRTIGLPPVIIGGGGGEGGGNDPPPNPYTPPARFVFFHLDHLGSPRAILDKNGNLVSRHNYLPFGEERPVQQDPTLNTRAFTGHERDAESGLDYMLARYYSSGLARFMAVDPGNDTQLENPQSWNRYSYTRNNPLRFIDPDGREVEVPKWMSGTVERGMPSAEFSSTFTRLDQNEKVHVDFKVTARAETGTRMTTDIGIDENGEITATINVPVGAGGDPALVGHELEHVEETLDTGKLLDQRFEEGDKTITKSPAGYESQRAKDAEKTIKSELKEHKKQQKEQRKLEKQQKKAEKNRK